MDSYEDKVLGSSKGLHFILADIKSTERGVIVWQKYLTPNDRILALKKLEKLAILIRNQ